MSLDEADLAALALAADVRIASARLPTLASHGASEVRRRVAPDPSHRPAP